MHFIFLEKTPTSILLLIILSTVLFTFSIKVTTVYALVPNPGHSYNEVEFPPGVVFTGSGNIKVTTNSTGTQPIALLTNGTTLLATDGGKVGIGTTSPDGTLEIAGSGTNTVFSRSGGTTNVINISVPATGDPAIVAGSGFGIGIRANAGSNNFTMDGINSVFTGKVGIGTTSPSSLLTIQGPNAVAGPDIFLTDGQGREFRIRGAGAGTAQVGTLSNHDLQFTTGVSGPNARMTITSGGNVGIGTSTPSQKLEVTGNIKISGAGNALIFPDGTSQTTAGGGGGGGTTAASNPIFGDGSDGDVTISSNTILSRDMFYNKLTINAGITLNTAGYRIFVNDTLTFGSATSRIAYNGNNGANGAGGIDNGVSGGSGYGLGGTGGGGLSGAYLGGSVTGGAGATTTTEVYSGVGNSGNGGNSFSNAYGGNGGAGGAGGGGGGYVGGVGGGGGISIKPATSAGNIRDIFTLGLGRLFSSSTIIQYGGGAGGGGGANGGDGRTNGYGGAGGGGGGGGGIVIVFAKTISGDGAVGSIGGYGGAGGNGASAVGGGGGGAGGGGGLAAAVFVNSNGLWTVDASGGAGGTGGAAGASSTAGSNGLAGSLGTALRIQVS